MVWMLQSIVIVATVMHDIGDLANGMSGGRQRTADLLAIGVWMVSVIRVMVIDHGACDGVILVACAAARPCFTRAPHGGTGSSSPREAGWDAAHSTAHSTAQHTQHAHFTIMIIMIMMSYHIYTSTL